ARRGRLPPRPWRVCDTIVSSENGRSHGWSCASAARKPHTWLASRSHRRPSQARRPASTNGSQSRCQRPPVGGLYDVAALSIEFYPDPREQEMVAALRQGDEKAFAWLVEQHHATLVRLALRYLPDIAAAEDVAQETWVQVVQGLGRFEFRSSLKTWMVSIMKNRARSRAARERRNMPVTEAWLATVSRGEAA